MPAQTHALTVMVISADAPTFVRLPGVLTSAPAAMDVFRRMACSCSPSGCHHLTALNRHISRKFVCNGQEACTSAGAAAGHAQRLPSRLLPAEVLLRDCLNMLQETSYHCPTPQRQMLALTNALLSSGS